MNPGPAPGRLPSAVLRRAAAATAGSSAALLRRMRQKVKSVFKKLSPVHPLLSQHYSYKINMSLI